MKSLNLIANQHLLSMNVGTVVPVVNEKSFINNEVSELIFKAFKMELENYHYDMLQDLIGAIMAMNYNEAISVIKETLSFFKEKSYSEKKLTPLFLNFPNCIDLEQDEYNNKRLTNHALNKIFVSKNDIELECGCSINTELFNLEEFGACPVCQFTSEKLASQNIQKEGYVSHLELTELSLSTDKDVYNLFKKLVSSKISPSEDTKELIKDMFELKGANIKGLLPKQIENKETAAFVSSLLVGLKNDIKYIKSYLKTATDILRFAAACSNSDISLSEKIKFKLSNKEKKIILKVLNSLNNPMEDLKRNRNIWLILFKMINVGAKKDNYPNAFNFADNLRNKSNEIETFNSKVESLLEKVVVLKPSKEEPKIDPDFLNNPFKELKGMVDNGDVILKNTSFKMELKDSEYVTQYQKDFIELVEVLTERPGEFARKLDVLLRNTDDQDLISFTLNKFKSVIKDVSNTVLLPLRTHILNRNTLERSAIIPKGNSSKMKMGEIVGKIDYDAVNDLYFMISEEMEARYMQKEHYKNVYISPQVKNFIVPSVVRNASKGAINLTRGSKMKINEETEILRLFTNWFNSDTVVDLDLSAVILDSDFNFVRNVYYGDYSTSGSFVFSGDVQSGHGNDGGSEFIDINLRILEEELKTKNKKASRYIAVYLNSYTHQTFDTFVGTSGYMERKEEDNGNKFEARSVKTRFLLSGKGQINTPIIYDVKKREVIWLDLQENISTNRVNNVNGVEDDCTKKLRIFTDYSKYKPNLLDLLELHQGRFENIDFIKDSEKDYDLIIDENFAMDLPTLMSEWI